MSTSLEVNLPPDLIALLDERATQEQITRQEALVRCLREWGLTRKPRKISPSGRLTTTDREASFSNPEESDKAGRDERG